MMDESNSDLRSTFKTKESKQLHQKKKKKKHIFSVTEVKYSSSQHSQALDATQNNSLELNATQKNSLDFKANHIENETTLDAGNLGSEENSSTHEEETGTQKSLKKKNKKRKKKKHTNKLDLNGTQSDILDLDANHIENETPSLDAGDLESEENSSTHEEKTGAKKSLKKKKKKKKHNKKIDLKDTQNNILDLDANHIENEAPSLDAEENIAEHEEENTTQNSLKKKKKKKKKNKHKRSLDTSINDTKSSPKKTKKKKKKSKHKHTEMKLKVEANDDEMKTRKSVGTGTDNNKTPQFSETKPNIETSNEMRNPDVGASDEDGCKTPQFVETKPNVSASQDDNSSQGDEDETQWPSFSDWDISGGDPFSPQGSSNQIKEEPMELGSSQESSIKSENRHSDQEVENPSVNKSPHHYIFIKQEPKPNDEWPSSKSTSVRTNLVITAKNESESDGNETSSNSEQDGPVSNSQPNVMSHRDEEEKTVDGAASDAISNASSVTGDEKKKRKRRTWINRDVVDAKKPKKGQFVLKVKLSNSSKKNKKNDKLVDSGYLQPSADLSTQDIFDDGDDDEESLPTNETVAKTESSADDIYYDANSTSDVTISKALNFSCLSDTREDEKEVDNVGSQSVQMTAVKEKVKHGIKRKTERYIEESLDSDSSDEDPFGLKNRTKTKHKSKKHVVEEDGESTGQEKDKSKQINGDQGNRNDDDTDSKTTKHESRRKVPEENRKVQDQEMERKKKKKHKSKRKLQEDKGDNNEHQEEEQEIVPKKHKHKSKKRMHKEDGERLDLEASHEGHLQEQAGKPKKHKHKSKKSMHVEDCERQDLEVESTGHQQEQAVEPKRTKRKSRTNLNTGDDENIGQEYETNLQVQEEEKEPNTRRTKHKSKKRVAGGDGESTGQENEQDLQPTESKRTKHKSKKRVLEEISESTGQEEPDENNRQLQNQGVEPKRKSKSKKKLPEQNDETVRRESDVNNLQLQNQGVEPKRKSKSKKRLLEQYGESVRREPGENNLQLEQQRVEPKRTKPKSKKKNTESGREESSLEERSKQIVIKTERGVQEGGEARTGDQQEQRQPRKAMGGNTPTTGKWKPEEDDILTRNMDRFCQGHDIISPRKLLFPGDYEDKKDIRKLIKEYDLFGDLGQGLTRDYFSVYARAKKLFDTRNNKGVWSEEELAELQRLYRIHGPKWAQIGKILERSGPSVCGKFRFMKKDKAKGRWSNAELHQLQTSVLEFMTPRSHDDFKKILTNKRNTLISAKGPWSNAELHQLQTAVLEFLTPGSHDFKNIPWSKVAEKVPTRDMGQCRSKWLLSNHLSIEEKHVWTGHDSVILIKRLYKSNITSESDINWKKLHEEDFPSEPTTQALKTRLTRLKSRHVNDHHNKNFREIVNELYHERAMWLVTSTPRATDGKWESKPSTVAAWHHQ